MAGTGDTRDQVGLQSFVGGMSTDIKYGANNQFYYSQHVDFRKKPGQFTVLPQGSPTAASGTVTDLLLAMDQVADGKRYAIGLGGKLYLVSTAGAWSSPGTLGENSGAGLLYRQDVDHLYATGQTKMGRVQFVSAAATLQTSWFQSGRSNNQKNATAYKTGGAATYTTPTSISETATALRAFKTDIEPIIKIGIKVVAKGTGNWTLTLHDDANNSLGAVTIANASVTAAAINYFTFSTPVRAYVMPNGRTYHFHVTSTVADGTVQTTTASSLADCDLEVHANALIAPKNGLHPMINFLQYTLIGNEHYVAAYEPLQDSPDTSDFDRHRITLPAGFEVCGFAQRNQYVVIGAEKRSDTGEFQQGALFFWDGVSQTYNDWWLVNEGSPEGLFSYGNIIYYDAGGALYRLQGTETPVKIKTYRNTDSEFSSVADSTHVYPNMMTVRRGILLSAYPSQTTNVTLEHGVYSLGSVTREYPESFGFSYTTSNGSLLNTGSKNLRIGMIRNFGDTLYISWRDDSKSPAYGCDVISNSSAPFSTFTLESLYFDGQIPFNAKRADKFIVTHDPLPAGVTLRLKYKIDHASSWTTLTTTQNTNYIIGIIGKKFYGIEFGVEGDVGATTPVIRSMYLFFDPLKNEREIG